MAKISVIDTDKIVSQTLADLRRLFADWGIEEWEPIPEKDGRAYTVRYLKAGQWVAISSQLQPTKSTNLRVCYWVIKNLKLWENRGVTGVAKGVTFVGGLVPVKEGAREDFEECCATLGVEPDASWEEIDRVYKVKAQYAHPDKGGDPNRFKRIQKAYEYLRKVKGPK